MCQKKKSLRIVIALLVVILSVTSLDSWNVKNHAKASQKSETSTQITDFAGNWYAGDSVLGKNIYAGYLKMRVQEDGEFSIIDVEAGNPGIEGKMSVVDDTNVKVECIPDDFDTPWPGLKLTDELEYHFYNENIVRLTYGDTSIIFYKENSKTFSFSKMDKSTKWYQNCYNQWLTSNGINKSVTYKLEIGGVNFAIYRMEKSGDTTFLASFGVIDFDKKTGKLKTMTELKDSSVLPKNWRSMSEGRHFQNFVFKYNQKNNSLAITFNKKTYTFYSGLTYGITKNSVYNKMVGKEWICKAKNKKISCYLNGDIPMISIYDTKIDGCADAAVMVDDKKKKVTLTWVPQPDQSYISENGITDLYDKYKKIKSVTYSMINSKKIVIKVNNKKYTFVAK